jgi:heme exporter protein D
MTIMEYFSFLPYGKYAFYIWFSYLSVFIGVGMLFLNTGKIKKKTFKQLKIKYLRQK